MTTREDMDWHADQYRAEIQAALDGATELRLFLNGEGPLDGLWFSDTVPGRAFWWRKHLRRIDDLARRVLELTEVLRELINSADAVDAEAERAQQPGASAWSSAPVVRMIHARNNARTCLAALKETRDD